MKEFETYKKDYQEMKSKYTSDEIIESMFLAIRKIDNFVGHDIADRVNVALVTCDNFYERIEKLENKIDKLEKDFKTFRNCEYGRASQSLADSLNDDVKERVQNLEKHLKCVESDVKLINGKLKFIGDNLTGR